MRPIKIDRIVIISSRIDNLERYFNDIRQYNIIGTESEIELARRIREGDKEAEERLILANLRFVVSVAKQYQQKGIEIDDLVMAGNIGLIKAARRFDASKGFKFISYAVWWIRQEIIEEIAKQKGYRNGGQMIKIRDIESRMDKKRQDERRMDVRLEDIEPGRYEKNFYKRYKRQYTSIDAPVSEESDKTMEVFLGEEDKGFDFATQKIEYILTLLKGILSEREYKIMDMYFGLEGEKLPLQAIAREMGLSRERCRQIVNEARAKILEQIDAERLREMII